MKKLKNKVCSLEFFNKHLKSTSCQAKLYILCSDFDTTTAIRNGLRDQKYYTQIQTNKLIIFYSKS
ncbi:hypothetical protein BpHYR1_041790 [Brachionus plicatilis]|uniref:Uncharacterized protein n=1 Tax=Brachionus plicatilis TaxID=10195 RepID=A0A3M7QH87_BRAPC|nr:hypothetical protein BpHYR1_041790 [Brachionus plicatilis]